MRRRDAGFTILEMMAVMLVGGMALAAAAALMVHGERAGRAAVDGAGTVVAGTRALQALERDLREAAAVEILPAGGIRGRTPRGPFAWGVEGEALVRTAGEARVVLARGIGSMEAERRGGTIEVVIAFAAPRDGGRPPALVTAVASRAAEGAR